MILKVKRLPHCAGIPEYKSDGAAGLDLCAALLNERELFAWDVYHLVPTGVAVQIPQGYEGQIRARSSWGKKLTYFHVGTIDSDYIGEIFCGFIPRRTSEVGSGDFALEIQRGERIGQLIIAPVARCTVQVVADLDETVRGTGGFGSTGR